jgi:hypothetical protein
MSVEDDVSLRFYFFSREIMTGQQQIKNGHPKINCLCWRQQKMGLKIEEETWFVIEATVTIEQWALIKHCLWMTKMVTHSKIVDPLYYVLQENIQF